MKISLVSEHASPLAALGGVDAGGQNVHVAELSAALRRRGHDVTVYTRRDSARLPREVDTPQGYRVVHVPAGPARQLPKDALLPHMDEFGEFLRNEWTRDEPDLVHAHFWMSGLACLAAVEGTGIPMVQTFHALGSVKKRHQGDADTSPEGRIELERSICRRADQVVATCSNEVFEIARMGVPLPRSRTSVIPCGVDLNLFTPEGPRAPRTARHRIVTAGRLVPRKGFEVAVAALARLPETELVIAGGPVEDDPEARRLSGLAEELGVADRLRMPGLVSRADMPPLLRSADAVVCTPTYEPFGMVPLETMASGTPVVGSAVGGLIDTVVDGRTGFLVPPGDPDAVAAAVRKLCASDQLREAYGAAGAARARKRYSWDQIAAETASVYHQVHTAGRTGRRMAL
ncbi:glycosyltransferase [Amycolatopsis pigmentata]|uniref:Glycosyltransferase n=1 Tax=Amycolatopsis pigmentata TaxID=450801 RepID=A0ABW5G0E0_9PSEU